MGGLAAAATESRTSASIQRGLKRQGAARGIIGECPAWHDDP